MHRVLKKHGTALLIVRLEIKRVWLRALVQSLQILMHLFDTLSKRLDQVFLQHVLRHLADYSLTPLNKPHISNSSLADKAADSSYYIGAAPREAR